MRQAGFAAAWLLDGDFIKQGAVEAGAGVVARASSRRSLEQCEGRSPSRDGGAGGTAAPGATATRPRNQTHTGGSKEGSAQHRVPPRKELLCASSIGVGTGPPPRGFCSDSPALRGWLE